MKFVVPRMPMGVPATMPMTSPLRTSRSSSRRLSATLANRSEEHTSELQSRLHLVCRLLLEKKKNSNSPHPTAPVTAVPSESTAALSIDHATQRCSGTVTELPHAHAMLSIPRLIERHLHSPG